MPSQRDRLDSYGDAVKLVHEIKQQICGSGDSRDMELVRDAQYAADQLKEEICRNRTTPVRKMKWSERLLRISARASRAEREKIREAQGKRKRIRDQIF